MCTANMRSLCCVGVTDDTTRVPLGVEGGYINASFIRMPVGSEEFVYIACQGPLPTTVADFWQMVWEQNCTVIAMMTQEVEGEKIKCQRYWPDVLNKTTMINDRLRLALVRLQQLKGFIIRVLELEEIQVSESNSACLEFFLSVAILSLYFSLSCFHLYCLQQEATQGFSSLPSDHYWAAVPRGSLCCFVTFTGESIWARL